MKALQPFKLFWFQQLVLYLITIPIGEIHTFWEHSKKVYSGVWFKTFDYPLGVQWYVKDNCEMINWVIVAIIGYRFSKLTHNRLLITVAFLYVLWRLADVPLYWLNYKTYGYGFVYIILTIIGIIFYKWR